jgi:hypothetical protein
MREREREREREEDRKRRRERDGGRGRRSKHGLEFSVWTFGVRFGVTIPCKVHLHFNH